MNYTVKAGLRSGTVAIPSSKSYAHRQLICAALSNADTVIKCDGFSKDIMATVECLRKLGTQIGLDDGYIRLKAGKKAKEAVLPCSESGSTLRFLLPVAGALGVSAVFEMAEGLAARPVDELLRVMGEHGINISRDRNSISVSGQMTAGLYSVPGNVSSQYISGLLFALPLLKADSKLVITGDIESADYIRMTENVLGKSGIRFTLSGNEYTIPGNQQYTTEKEISVEQDWSNAAFFLCMGALSEKGITIEEMPIRSSQGDRAIMQILADMGADIETAGSRITVKRKRLKALTIDAATIPDLVPVIAAAASLCEGTTVIRNAQRLRIKESDRLRTTSDMLKALGADIEELDDGLIIKGRTELTGGMVDACNDHRIAMAAAVAACGCREDVTVLGSECVAKSYPKFWEHLEALTVSIPHADERGAGNE